MLKIALDNWLCRYGKYEMEQILVLGHGGHARSLIDILERENKYQIAYLA